MLTLLTTTGTEPVTVDEAGQAARVDGAELNGFIAGAITSARESAEHITGRCYRPQTQRVELLDWPASSDLFPVFEPTAVAISYWTGAAWAVLDQAAYAWAAVGTRTGVAPALGTSWPALGARAVGARVRIDISAGPASPAQVSESVKLYIKAQVAAWVDTPAAQRVSQQLVPNPLFASLLDAERLWA